MSFFLSTLATFLVLVIKMREMWTYHSVALLFNQLKVLLSVLRNVAAFDLNLRCRDNLLELCSCFTEIHQYWWNRMAEIGRRTTTLVHLGPPDISVCGAGRPRFILPQELLENLRKSRQLLGNEALQNPSILFNEQLLLNLIRPSGADPGFLKGGWLVSSMVERRRRQSPSVVGASS